MVDKVACYVDPRLSILSVIKIRKDLCWLTVPMIKGWSGNVLSLGDSCRVTATAPSYVIHAGFLRIEGGEKVLLRFLGGSSSARGGDEQCDELLDPPF